MDLQTAKETILSTEDINRLYECEIWLNEVIGNYHKSLRMEDRENSVAIIELKSNLTIANTLLSICQDRKIEVKDKGGRLNYNFRMAAKTMLVPGTYDAIMKKAILPRQEVKEQQEQLKKNRYFI